MLSSVVGLATPLTPAAIAVDSDVLKIRFPHRISCFTRALLLRNALNLVVNKLAFFFSCRHLDQIMLQPKCKKREASQRHRQTKPKQCLAYPTVTSVPHATPTNTEAQPSASPAQAKLTPSPSPGPALPPAQLSPSPSPAQAPTLNDAFHTRGVGSSLGKSGAPNAPLTL